MTATVTRQDISINVEVSGDIEPLEQVEVKAEVSAKIKKIHPALGDVVERGQLLFELDDQELLTQLATAELEIQSARLNLERRVSDHDRNLRLFEKELIPKRDVSDSATDLELAKNSVARAQKGLQNVQDKLEKTKVLSPISGKILDLPVVEGQVVVAAASVNSGTLLMRIADLGNLIIKTHINQIDVAKLQPGMKAKFFVDPIPGEEFAGEIYTIAPTASVKQNVKGFQVVLRITQPDPRLRPGMTANVVIPIETRQQVLAVPLAAVFSAPDRSKTAYVAAPNNPSSFERRPIEIGAANLDFVEVVSGLTEGDIVSLTRPERGKDGEIGKQ